MNNQINIEIEAKREWTRPELNVIEAGSAENGEGTTLDISDPQRS